jgi:hypothetical protein
MRQRYAIALILLIVHGACGCRARQLGSDQDRFRHALLQMQTQQIMDNLVRIHRGLPIVHMDYTQITGTVTQDAQADLTGIPSDVLLGLSGKQENQLTVTGNPVIDPNVYMAYLDFVNKENHLIVTEEPPPEGAAHLCQECCGSYYWIPAEFRIEFLELSLKVGGMRGQPQLAPDFVSATVNEATRHFPGGEVVTDDPANGDKIYLILKLDKSMKADRGKVQFSIDEMAYTVEMQTGSVVSGTEQDQILIKYIFGTNGEKHQIAIPPAEMIGKLKNREVKIYSATYRPPAPTPEVLLNSINHNLGLIRLQNLSRNK